MRDFNIAVLIPCHNEATTIGKVVADFFRSLPSATIYVYDNRSTDATAERARAAGAIVRQESLSGKGNVVRRMFADIEANVYLLVDGDDTYDAAAAGKLVECLIDNNLDMVNAARVAQIESAYRRGHKFGNLILTKLVATIFGDRFSDMLSGYRVFSYRFVKSFPALSTGFEIETELTVHALEQRMPVAEVSTSYRDRPEGSTSKLNTIRDGIRIVKTIILLVKEERPLTFFSWTSVIAGVLAFLLAWPVVAEYVHTGMVPRFPTFLLATTLLLISFVSFGIGLILDTVTHGRRELRRLMYLRVGQFGRRTIDRRFQS